MRKCLTLQYSMIATILRVLFHLIERLKSMLTFPSHQGFAELDIQLNSMQTNVINVAKYFLNSIFFSFGSEQFSTSSSFVRVNVPYDLSVESALDGAAAIDLSEEDEEDESEEGE